MDPCFFIVSAFYQVFIPDILANTLVVFMLLDVFVHPYIGCLCVVVVETGGDGDAAIKIRRQASSCLLHTAARSSGRMLIRSSSYACVKSIGLD